jgi:hypothetical protein
VSSSNRDNRQTDADQAVVLKHALDEVSQLKKEISRLQAEVAFKDQVIKSLQHESNKFKPGAYGQRASENVGDALTNIACTN